MLLQMTNITPLYGWLLIPQIHNELRYNSCFNPVAIPTATLPNVLFWSLCLVTYPKKKLCRSHMHVDLLGGMGAVSCCCPPSCSSQPWAREALDSGVWEKEAKLLSLELVHLKMPEAGKSTWKGLNGNTPNFPLCKAVWDCQSVTPHGNTALRQA